MSGVAIVTGGGQGIGAAIVQALLDEGYKVCVADVNVQNASDLVQKSKEEYGGDRIEYFQCDVAEEENLRKTFDFAANKLGVVNLLVNNAGIADETNPKNIVNVNVMGPINGCRVALERMGKRRGGKGGIVVNTASISGLIGIQHYLPVYVASKHAVVGLTRAYGTEHHMEHEGILFCAVCPSATRTPLLEDSARILGIEFRELMSPEFVAQGVIKLIKDKINGSTLLVTKRDGYTYVPDSTELEKYFV